MLNRPSLITFTDALPGPQLEEFARRIEALQYDSLWVPEFTGRDPYTTAAWILARTTSLQVATGIANVYAHDAIVAAQNRCSLAELSGGRFALGLGVSHPPMAEQHDLPWIPPARKMRTYLDAMDAATVSAPAPAQPAPLWLAANGPLMLTLVRDRCDGANTYLLPPTHTRTARTIIGPDPRLTVTLPCCQCEDPDLARRIARRGLAAYMDQAAYQDGWQRCGFEPADWANGGSDRLIDELVAWGDLDSIHARIAEHEAAGASHIAIIPYPTEPGIPWGLIEAMAA